MKPVFMEQREKLFLYTFVVYIPQVHWGDYLGIAGRTQLISEDHLRATLYQGLT